jgi:murein DD-endopeptidase MepM/ murein hydrolase activator NlpD
VARLAILFVPASGRQPVAIRLGSSGYRLLVAAIICSAVLVLIGLGLVPLAIRDLSSRSAFGDASRTSERLAERQSSLVQRFSVLQSDARVVGVRLGKTAVTYGLDPVLIESAPGAPPASLGDRVRELDEAVGDLVGVVRQLLEEIERFEESNPEIVGITPSISPLRGNDFVLTETVGYARSPFTEKEEYHAGVDLSAPAGTPIYAPAAGQVVFAGRYPVSRRSAWWRQGKLVAVRSGDRFVTLFGHCDQVEVRRGDRVKRGDRLATVGSSGWSPNSLLHYGVWRQVEGEYRPQDPRLFMLDRRWQDDLEILAVAREPLPQEPWDRLPRALRGP